MIAINEHEIARRAPVWTALAELFLDTELQDYQRQYIVDTLRQSGYSLEELQNIFSQEVAPVFHANLRTMTGEWQPWSADFVKERVLAYLGKRPTLAERFLPLGWLRGRQTAPVQKQWEAIQNLFVAE